VDQDNPGVRKNAQKNIDRMKVNHQKCYKQNTKRKNLEIANFSDFDKAGQQRKSSRLWAIARSATPRV
jgi:hypothetical protein